MNLTQRARGVMGTMSVWAAVFGVAGVAGSLPLSLLGEMPPFESGRFLRIAVEVFVRWGLGGAGMGFAFAAAILLAERKRTLIALSQRRFSFWGFVAGALVPMGHRDGL